MLIDRYFVVEPEHNKQGRVLLVPDNDVLGIAVLINAFVIFRDSERVIVKVRLNEITAKHLSEMVNTDLDNTETVKSLGITGRYIGKDFSDIYKRFPDLDKKVKYKDEDGTTFELPLVKDMVIA